jgi:hypothetical protein
LVKVPVNPHKGCHAFPDVRGVHQNCALFAFSEAEIFSDRRVAGKRLTNGGTPGGGIKKLSCAVVKNCVQGCCHAGEGLTRTNRRGDKKQNQPHEITV